MLGNIDEDTYYSKQCHEINEQSFVCLFFDLSVTKNSHNFFYWTEVLMKHCIRSLNARTYTTRWPLWFKMLDKRWKIRFNFMTSEDFNAQVPIHWIFTTMELVFSTQITKRIIFIFREFYFDSVFFSIEFRTLWVNIIGISLKMHSSSKILKFWMSDVLNVF